MDLLNISSLLASVEQGYVLKFDADFLMELLPQIISTCVLIALLSLLLYKPVREFLSKRVERIKNQIDDAANNQKTAAELKASYETKLLEVSRERDDILKAAHVDAGINREQIIAAAHKEAETIKLRAQKEIALERQKAFEEVRKHIVDASNLLASKWVSAKIDEKIGGKLIDEAISEIGGPAWQS